MKIKTRNKLEIRHLKLHQETLKGKEIEHKLKEEQQTEKQEQLKEDVTEDKKSKQITKRTNPKK